MFYTQKRLKASVIELLGKCINIIMHGCYIIVWIQWILKKEMVRNEMAALSGLSYQNVLVPPCMGP